MFAEFVGNNTELGFQSLLRIRRGFVDLTSLDTFPEPSQVCSDAMFPTWLSVTSFVINLVFLVIVIRIPMFRVVAYRCCLMWINSIVQRVRAIVVIESRDVVEEIEANAQPPAEFIDMENRPHCIPDPNNVNVSHLNPFIATNEGECRIDIDYHTECVVSRTVPIQGHEVMV